MKITQMISGQSGRPVANQFEISDNDKRFFQSYNSIIVMIDSTGVYLDEVYWDYSKTTSKYRNQFLGDTTAEIKAKIKSGQYKLVDLNA
jgi:hypothetical protein